MASEIILCLENAYANSCLITDGFIPWHEDLSDRLLSSDHMWFAPRHLVEHRSDFRQIIPYIVVAYGDSVLIYRRAPRSNETRLHGLYSLGFGGHVGIADAVIQESALDVRATITTAAKRETAEELSQLGVSRRQLIGVINDTTTDVSRHHIGIVEVWAVTTPSIVAIEDTITECQFVMTAELHKLKHQMESWSCLCADILISQPKSA